MQKIVLILLFVVSHLVPNGCIAQASSNNKPKIVVGLMVDQMRWDYLYKYRERYGEGGFKRLLSEGFSCENTMIRHAP